MSATATTTTDPHATDLHGPAGSYTVVFTGRRRDDAIGAISAKGPQPYDADRLVVGINITGGYTVANNSTFTRIIEILGYTVDHIDGFLHPDGTTIWLDRSEHV